MDRQPGDIDDALLRRLAALSRGSQRWVRTALITLEALRDTLPSPAPDLDEGEAPPLSRRRGHTERLPEPGRGTRGYTEAEPERERPPANLEDVITGKADLREQLEAYPELQEELDGLADIIEMLREAGEARRRRGEQILREEILGQPPEDDEPPEGLNGGRRRRR